MGNRTGIRSLLNSKGKLYKRRGQPKLNPEIRVGIVARIKMYKKAFTLQSLIAVTKLKNFPWLLKHTSKIKKVMPIGGLKDLLISLRAKQE